MLIAHVEVDGRLVDVRLAEGRIVEIGTRLDGPVDVDGRGGALIPGLHDHHIHLAATAAEAASVPVGPGDVRDVDAFAAALRRGAAGEWVRATGYHESVAGELDRWRLDALVPDRPVRVQHRTGALWVWNSAALRAAGLLGPGEGNSAAPASHLPIPADGRFWRQDARLRDLAPPTSLDLPAVGRAAAARGVTGFTNADPQPAPGLSALLAPLRQRVVVMGVDGPVKFLLDDATLPGPDELAARFAAVRPAPVAVHCVTRTQVLVTLLALEDAGPVPGDRIEHGSVLPEETLPWLRRLGVTVVTQPHFPVERGREYATDVDPDDRPHLYRLRSLADAGIPVAAGTDAPYGTSDPWRVVHAAVHRPDGERVGPRAALDLFLGDPGFPGRVRRVRVGAAADLVLLRVPLRDALDVLCADVVRETFVGGRRLFPPKE
ncbi:MAG: amidohydrolase family protein [Streptomycetaceae bacterium]|nr:amidohydrolase family protein [Streptomycetaceae bacterium]